MALYDPRLVDYIIGGTNITHNGEVIVVRSYGGDFVDHQAGAKGDKVTYAKYDQFQTHKISQLFNTPYWTQFESWADNHTKLNVQYTDSNTGEKKTSTTAYVKIIDDVSDGQERSVTVYCEEVV